MVLSGTGAVGTGLGRQRGHGPGGHGEASALVVCRFGGVSRLRTLHDVG